MNKYFIKIKLGELTEIIAGGDKPKIFSENKTSLNTFPVFANAEGNNGLLGYTNLPRIIEPAVTISARGSKVGFAALRKQPFFPIVRLLTLIPQKDKLDVDFLFYNLKLNRQNGTGSGQPQITIPEISEKIISVPPLLTQQKIASVLSALDSKIELNNRINAELEAMAKTLYDYWFVQFDFPFDFAQGKPNANGKPYKSTGGKMVWNEELKREIPEGWEVGTLLDIANYENGLPCQKYRPTGADFYRVIKIREMNEGFSSNTEFVRTAIPEKAIIENGDILFSWSASLDVKIWTSGKGALNQHIFKVTSNNYPKSFYFYQLINYLQHFKMMAENRKTTMGHITQEHLKQSRIVIPPKQFTIELEKIIAPLFSKKVINEIENQKLTELRDWLLPMLMNGQVKVMDEMENELSLAAEPKIEYGK
jgi:type I restriction enzyme S subunit